MIWVTQFRLLYYISFNELLQNHSDREFKEEEEEQQQQQQQQKTLKTIARDPFRSKLFWNL